MKIGFFTDAYFPQINGVAISVDDLASGLRKNGHEVYIIAPNYPHSKKEKYVIRLKSMKVKKNPQIRLATYVPEKSLLKLVKIDFDVIQGFSGGTITSLGLVIARIKGVPFIFTYNTRWNKYTHHILSGKVLKPKVFEKMGKVFGNKCDAVIAPSNKIKKELLSFGVKKPIAVIPSGVDVDLYKKQWKGFLRDKINITKKEKILLYVGRLEKEKSIDFLLKSFKKINASLKNTHFVLVGDGSEKKKLQALTKKLSIDSNVHFLGFVDPSEKHKVYSDADIFIFASQTETEALVISEALAAGVPVVAVYDKVLEDLIKTGVNGLLIEKNQQVFAKQVCKLLSNKNLVNLYSKNSKLNLNVFTLQNSLVLLEKLYQDVISKNRRNSSTLYRYPAFSYRLIRKLAASVT